MAWFGDVWASPKKGLEPGLTPRGFLAQQGPINQDATPDLMAAGLCWVHGTTTCTVSETMKRRMSQQTAAVSGWCMHALQFLFCLSPPIHPASIRLEEKKAQQDAG